MKVRIAILVAPDGSYSAGGWGNGLSNVHGADADWRLLQDGMPDDIAEANMKLKPYVIVADVPLPQPAEIQGTVEP